MYDLANTVDKITRTEISLYDYNKLYKHKILQNTNYKYRNIIIT